MDSDDAALLQLPLAVRRKANSSAKMADNPAAVDLKPQDEQLGKDSVPSEILTAATAMLATLLLATLAMLLRSCGQHRTVSALRRRVETMKVTAVDELKRLAENPGSAKAVRLMGRVVVEVGTSSLTAPLSSTPCVLYAASATQLREDVHQPPLAFHQKTSKFCIAVGDGDKELRIFVSGEDVSLFDIAAEGKCGGRAGIVDAPPAWRSFVLGGLKDPGLARQVRKEGSSSGVSTVPLDLSSHGAEIEFKESCLPVDSMVTCVGEVVWDRSGGVFRLCPYRPSQGTDVLRCPSWNSPADSWKEALATTRVCSQATELLAGKVLVSNCPMLRDQGRKWRFHRFTSTGAAPAG